MFSIENQEIFLIFNIIKDKIVFGENQEPSLMLSRLSQNLNHRLVVLGPTQILHLCTGVKAGRGDF